MKTAIERTIMIMACLLAAAVTVSLLSGCSSRTEPPGQGSAVSSSPEGDVEFSASQRAEVRYEQLLSEEIRASGAYEEAVELGAVIVSDNRPVTSGDWPRAFAEKAARGEDASLLLWSIYGWNPEQADVLDVASENGTLKRRWGSYTPETGLDWSDWQDLTSVVLTQWGYLVMEDGISTEPMSWQVVSGYELYDDYAKRQELYHTYLEPILYAGLGSEWSDPRDVVGLWVYEDIANYEGRNPFDAYDSDWPVSDITQTLARYFDIDVADTRARIVGLNNGQEYDAATDTIHYEGGRGGGMVCYWVEAWSENGSELTIEYKWYDMYTGQPGDDVKRLTVRLLEDGSFRYLSNLQL